MLEGVSDAERIGLAVRGASMREPDEVAAMVRLKALGWGVRRIARTLGCTARRRCGGILGRAAGWRIGRRRDQGRRMGSRRGSRSGSGAIAAMPTWCARTWRVSMASR